MVIFILNKFYEEVFNNLNLYVIHYCNIVKNKFFKKINCLCPTQTHFVMNSYKQYKCSCEGIVNKAQVKLTFTHTKLRRQRHLCHIYKQIQRKFTFQVQSGRDRQESQ